MLPVLPATLLLAWVAERARERERPIYLHGTGRGPFRKFSLSRDASFEASTPRGWGHGVIYFSSPDRCPGRKTQAEHIGEGPFGGWIAAVHLADGKLFDPFNDPEAKRILTEARAARGRRTPESLIIDYTEAPEIVEAAIEHGYNTFEFYEPSVQCWSRAITEIDLIEIVAWHRWDGHSWHHVDVGPWWKAGVDRIVDTEDSSEHDWDGAGTPTKDLSRSWLSESESGRDLLTLVDRLDEKEPGISHRSIVTWHVSDDPEKVLRVLKNPVGDLGATRQEWGFWGDIGPGLYGSGHPQAWMSRSAGKWQFLDRLDTEDTRRLVEEIKQEHSLQDPGYLTSSEMEIARSYLDRVARGTMPPGHLIRLAEQPYNILFWRPSYLAKVGIVPGRQPDVVPMVLRGRFAEMNSSWMPEDLYASLRANGIHGAYTKAGWGTEAEIVTWDKQAVLAFDGWTEGTDEAPLTRDAHRKAWNDIRIAAQKVLDEMPHDLAYEFDGYQRGVIVGSRQHLDDVVDLHGPEIRAAFSQVFAMLSKRGPTVRLYRGEEAVETRGIQRSFLSWTEYRPDAEDFTGLRGVLRIADIPINRFIAVLPHGVGLDFLVTPGPLAGERREPVRISGFASILIRAPHPQGYLPGTDEKIRVEKMLKNEGAEILYWKPILPDDEDYWSGYPPQVDHGSWWFRISPSGWDRLKAAGLDIEEYDITYK